MWACWWALHISHFVPHIRRKMSCLLCFFVTNMYAISHFVLLCVVWACLPLCFSSFQPSLAPLRWSMRWPALTSHHWGKVAVSHRSVLWDSGQTSQPVCSNCPVSQPCTRKCWVEVSAKTGRVHWQQSYKVVMGLCRRTDVHHFTSSLFLQPYSIYSISVGFQHTFTKAKFPELTLFILESTIKTSSKILWLFSLSRGQEGFVRCGCIVNSSLNFNNTKIPNKFKGSLKNI